MVTSVNIKDANDIIFITI